ncbi:gamma-mobile-trio recombinase GmtY [Vibrio lentus]|uniref:Tyr recombinase domain-containing protein n=1 Tax=Vibrio lentus TaxID=136468 RepID=A0AB36XSE9_9VIBR|nr:gamma-mobile-trio recombinase GmtY [Vibrio lentus]MCC4836772.1 site-specific integrase [Vibrio lentus]PMI16404.1 hypothetical protein BCU51_03170 [Vibrio lentus]PMK35408.1 hypothetical protein BCU02_13515 [Vibrio lentus]PMK49944.1 hypothetical protein BCT99_00595 [Vibrio lentus]PML31619.1 hypothetical protein BCT79_04385 [Vibrio lentus]
MNLEHTILVVKLKVRMTKHDSNIFVLPLIFIGEQLLASYARYAYLHRRKSNSWHQKSASAVALFMKYIAKRRKDFPDPVSCFKAFVDDLEYGTIDPQTGQDFGDLYWAVRSSKNTNKFINYISKFNQYNYRQAEEYASKNDSTTKAILLNKQIPADSSEKHIKLAAWHHRHSNAFLPHTLKRNQSEMNFVDEVRSHYHNGNNLSTPLYTFPKSRIFDLLSAFKTHTKSGDFVRQYNLRDMLVTMLMHFGGLRMSEPFHLYVEDIMENPNHPGEALVKLYHPDSRTARLARMGLRPRTDARCSHSYRAGWKNKNINEVTTVKWFPVEAGEWFWDLWVLYITQQRVEAPYDNIHPFAFTQKDGKPASYSSFNQAHKRAVERLGLIVAKKNGTTPHSHRHTYGSDVWEQTQDQVILQKVLRHSSPMSQYVYIHPSDERIRDSLNDSFNALKQMTNYEVLNKLDRTIKKDASSSFRARLTEYSKLETRR